MAIRLLIWLAVIVVGSVIESIVQDATGTEITYQTKTRRAIYGAVSGISTIVTWEVLNWAMGWSL